MDTTLRDCSVNRYLYELYATRFGSFSVLFDGSIYLLLVFDGE